MINATNDNKPQNTSTMPSPASTVTNSIPMSGETAKVIETLNTPQEPTEDRIDVMRGLNPEASHNPNPTSTTEVPLGSVPKTAAVPLVNSATMPAMDQFAKPTMDPTGSTMGQAASPAISPDLSASKPPAMTPAIEKPMTPSSPPAMEKPLGFDNRNDGLKPKKKFNIKMIGGMLVLLLIILGASAGFFLSQQTQDLRQQAYDGQPCNDSNDCSLVDEGEVCINNFCTTPTACIDLLTLSDCDASVAPDCAWYSCNNSCHPNGTPLEEVCGQVGDACDSQNQCLPPLVCHCQDGNACTIRECEDPSETEDWCRALNQDRWCLNQGGQAYTCCAEGYSCCSGYNGCCANNPPTTPPTTPPPTFSCNSPCATNAQCTNVNPDWTCDSNKCRLASNPTSITCEPEVVPPVCNGACTTTAECSAVNPDWICNGANKCVLASNPTSTTCAEEVNNVTCDDLTGTLTAGTIADQTTEMNYSLTYSGGTQVTSAQVTIHGNFDGPGWVDTWANLGVDTILTDGVFSGTTTYDDIIDLLVATGHDRQQIIDEGVIYSADVYSAAGFCQSDNTLSISGEVCEFNSKCQGLIELKATDTTELSCNDSCTTNAQCSDVNSNWYCDPDSDKCRRESNPTSTNCAVKIVNDDSDDPAAIVGCNETCVTNSDCTNNDHICVTTADGSNRCRLESYTSSVSCVLPTGATPQPSLPPALPQTGPEDWLNWLKAGLITLGIGSVLFFLL